MSVVNYEDPDLSFLAFEDSHVFGLPILESLERDDSQTELECSPQDFDWGCTARASDKDPRENNRVSSEQGYKYIETYASIFSAVSSCKDDCESISLGMPTFSLPPPPSPSPAKKRGRMVKLSSGITRICGNKILEHISPDEAKKRKLNCF
ncbi:hypothetical protein GUITHDRAFT_107586 [Guillardia theta CCMP2712]|uniref:Uncharacterized protein n=1 Tax=Guillardia theta (strain CCMP2712) TaxID=905079 RepID=L1JCX9_GUITC|nr:hypothetical protein GUITHDRAFT_107586 [Guillardia theta CCMP2712]EKX46383.1 hypothetical protein GUITHDRAFT_107586 [Guillardia theta CCMP2712]|eukprot:XP_005833363.1 hypothetical protein GUITHDRAFT_107586 [Guillardia theta CCMP2712]